MKLFVAEANLCHEHVVVRLQESELCVGVAELLAIGVEIALRVGGKEAVIFCDKDLLVILSLTIPFGRKREVTGCLCARRELPFIFDCLVAVIVWKV